MLPLSIVSICLIINSVECNVDHGDQVSVLYRGEYFPKQYLTTGSPPTTKDLYLFLNKLNMTLEYILPQINYTDMNTALSLFFAKAVLLKTVQDYEKKMPTDIFQYIKSLLRGIEYGLSHIYCKVKMDSLNHIELRMADAMKEDFKIIVDAIEDMNKDRMLKWIFNDIQMNNLARQFDSISFPKQDYVNLGMSMDSLTIDIFSSDFCLSRMIRTPPAPRPAGLRACRPDFFCDSRMMSAAPSAAYALSHRQLNVMMRHVTRRCYVSSPAADRRALRQMCAAMYREAVYIARRGFFSRDMFLEHIALCSMLGYEEFHRTSWYKKIASWYNKGGCLSENFNHEVNRSKLYGYQKYNSGVDKDAYTLRQTKRLKKYSKKNFCDNHPTVLSFIVMSQAVRYAIHTM